MRHLLWIGHPYFYADLAACGWQESSFCPLDDFRLFSWHDLVKQAGFEPELLVVADKSTPPFVLGMEDFPCLTVFYSVDSHIHSWHPLYAQGFDICLISLRDHAPLFAGPFLPGERIFWSPPYAPDHARPPEKSSQADGRQWDCLFVGTVNENTPGRREFLRWLGLEAARQARP